ncbi:MAG: PPC domain-containing protein, partial [Anaerolineae bacterium]|nr:PPC domain-containing protein [Anaerolineae bacterium]
AGAFTLDTQLDLARGDYADVYVYDAEGNYQYAYDRPVPAIVADLNWNEVVGYWGDPNADHLTVILKDSGGTVKDTDSWVWVDSYDGEFDAWMWSTIIPTDIIEVTDGVVTETMTVQNLTARLDGGTGHLTGNAGSGHLLAELWDFRRDSGYWYSYCSEIAVASPYDLTFGGAQVGGQDDAEVWNTGPDGHYTHRYPFAFTVNAQKDADDVWGYSETPDTQVTITLKSGVTTKAIYTTTADSDGYYDAWLSAGTPVTITQGDTLQVQTGDGDSTSLPIPQLTANADAANNRVYGKSPASEPVRARIQRNYNWGWYSHSRNTIADGSGNYGTDFNGLYWSRDCSAVDVGHHCAQPAAYYYNAAGHSVQVEGAEPPPVGPDVYENDDTHTTASAYTEMQSHTFHVYSDTDWVSFTVPAMDVTEPVSYVIETQGLGWGMDTYLYLYDTDGSTLLVEDDDGGEGLASRIAWTPPAAGTYYVLVEPYDEDSTEYCDAIYDLMILPVRAQIYLPLVMREY